MDIVLFAHSFLESYLKSNMAPPLNRSANKRTEWNSPDPGWIKVNVDALLFSEKKCTGMGTLARDHTGSCIAWCTDKIDQRLSPEEAEAATAVKACQLCRTQLD
ncbi:hypothetical protein CDL12_23156 [Handroanthus impetiginosus]|uniref:RNase H type-1 domain-containing protein n=1 Tax=Handroanthus impetiginosus TaxID=429701 RepID=A0A2G9GGA3_9LAMI|nr:hypothetical protein CDL12_23156 [Handroanthus impetiginosus]